MLRVIIIQIVIAVELIPKALGAQGDIRISGGGKSGLLQYNKGYDDWGAICTDGFDDDAAGLACAQLGYYRSTDFFTYSYDNDTDNIYVCYTFCLIDDNKLSDCDLSGCDYESPCTDGVVGITCTNSLPTAVIIVIVASVLVFIAVISSPFIYCLCIYCYHTPSCPCYNLNPCCCCVCCDSSSGSTTTESRTLGVVIGVLFLFLDGAR